MKLTIMSLASAALAVCWGVMIALDRDYDGPLQGIFWMGVFLVFAGAATASGVAALRHRERAPTLAKIGIYAPWTLAALGVLWAAFSESLLRVH